MLRTRDAFISPIPTFGLCFLVKAAHVDRWRSNDANMRRKVVTDITRLRQPTLRTQWNTSEGPVFFFFLIIYRFWQKYMFYMTWNSKNHFRISVGLGERLPKWRIKMGHLKQIAYSNQCNLFLYQPFTINDSYNVYLYISWILTI